MGAQAQSRSHINKWQHEIERLRQRTAVIKNIWAPGVSAVSVLPCL